ncbi:hypothetical protein ACLOJK_031420 [Asimina triloba]
MQDDTQRESIVECHLPPDAGQNRPHQLRDSGGEAGQEDGPHGSPIRDSPQIHPLPGIGIEERQQQVLDQRLRLLRQRRPQRRPVRNHNPQDYGTFQRAQAHGVCGQRHERHRQQDGEDVAARHTLPLARASDDPARGGADNEDPKED